MADTDDNKDTDESQNEWVSTRFQCIGCHKYVEECKDKFRLVNDKTPVTKRKFWSPFKRHSSPTLLYITYSFALSSNPYQ